MDPSTFELEGPFIALDALRRSLGKRGISCEISYNALPTPKGTLKVNATSSEQLEIANTFVEEARAKHARPVRA